MGLTEQVFHALSSNGIRGVEKVLLVGKRSCKWNIAKFIIGKMGGLFVWFAGQTNMLPTLGMVTVGILGNVTFSNELSYSLGT